MTAIKLDGEALATAMKAALVKRITALGERGITPGLATLLVGDDAPSEKYVSMKHDDCAALGITSVDERLPATASEADVMAVVERFNSDASIHACLLQHPFPPPLDYESILLRVDPVKDADGMHPVNLGLLVMGVKAPLSCTPAGIQALLVHHEVPIEGRHVVIIGRGLTIGRPLANLLALKWPHANAAVTVVHTGVTDLASYTRQADLLIAAAGAPGLVTADMVKPGAAVVAAGVTFRDGKAVSDVDPAVGEVAGWLSPRIGGVGPMTRAMLYENTVHAAERSVAHP